MTSRVRTVCWTGALALAVAAWGCGSTGGDSAEDAGDDVLDVVGDEPDGPGDGEATREDAETGEGSDDGRDESADDGTDGEVPCLCAADTDCDDGHSCNGEERCVDCACLPGTAAVDGTACDDGDPCTEGEACASGDCAGGAAICACETDDDCTAHDDGDLCNGWLVCVGRRCLLDPGTVVFCDPSGDTECLVNTCAPGTGDCAPQPVREGLSCDDGNECTAGDACADGACAGGASTCECTSDADCAAYEDGDACNGTLHCEANACVIDPATIVTCDPGGDTDCRVSLCDPADGTCSLVPRADGTTCDDGSACTLAEACAAGVCTGPARSCDDADVCTDDSCVPATGCTFTNNTAACDDGSACTAGDVCSGGACAGTAIVCNDGDVCTDDACDPATGCTFTDNSAACDDGDACSGGDMCAGGECFGELIFCGDANPCTDDGCNPATGCTFTNNTAACDDGNPCTAPDACAGGSCAGTPLGGTVCGLECVDTQTDERHCGGCVRPCVWDEECAAGACRPRPWERVGAAVNPLLPALAHALGTNGATPYVAWVADETQDNVYVHSYAAATGWTQLGARLTTGMVSAQSYVDIQFAAGAPYVVYYEPPSMPPGNPYHVKSWDGTGWVEVGTPGYRSPCVMHWAVSLAMEGTNPHLTDIGAGGCGIGVGYARWTGAAWWETPSPPGPMLGLLTMSGGGCSDVVWNGPASRSLVALIDSNQRRVRTWIAAPAPGAWTDLGGSLNMGAAPISGPGGDFLSIAVDAAGVPYVAFSEVEGAGGGSRGVFVKRYDPAGTGWTRVGAGRISTAGNAADFPSIAFVDGRPHVAFVETTAGVGLVLVRRWNGTAWERVGAPLNESNLTSAAMPYLVAIGTVPAVAFREPAAGTSRVYVKRFP
ncbi:MAG: hypothetical protein HY907_09950 [Deltaproteobacteria bacterium]|nr:hypothetical protein [Deltaproteobacteria bacterium]